MRRQPLRALDFEHSLCYFSRYLGACAKTNSNDSVGKIRCSPGCTTC